MSPRDDWRGRRPPKDLPWLTKAGSWNAWNRGNIVSCFDLDPAKHTGPGWFSSAWTIILFGCLIAYAAWAALGGR